MWVATFQSLSLFSALNKDSGAEPREDLNCQRTSPETDTRSSYTMKGATNDVRRVVQQRSDLKNPPSLVKGRHSRSCVFDRRSVSILPAAAVNHWAASQFSLSTLL